MSCEVSADLQSAVYRRLNDEAITIGSGVVPVHDAPLRGHTAGIRSYVTLGEELVRPFGSMTSGGAIHDFDVTVHSGMDGFAEAKLIAGRICDLLLGKGLELDHGQLVDLRFLRAKAERGRSPVKRSINLRFRAVIDAD